MLAAAGLAEFALIAEDLADGGGLVAHDQAVLACFLDHRADAWVRAARLVSALGGFTWLLIAAAVVVVWLWARRGRSALAFAPLIALLLASVASTTAKA